MRAIVAGCLGLALAGCASVPAGQGGLPGAAAFMTDVVTPGAREKYQAQVDDTKCREFGHEPKTRGYADCRLKRHDITLNRFGISKSVCF